MMSKTHFGTNPVWGGLALAGLLLIGCPESGEQANREPDASPQKDDDAGTDAGHGELSCQERLDKAGTELTAAVARHAVCTADADCKMLPNETGCGGSCGASANAAQSSALAQEVAAIDAKYCASYMADGCPYSTPDCDIAFPVCEAGMCTAVYGASCEADTPSVLTGGRRSFGMCGSRCKSVLALGGASTEACHDVVLDIFDSGFDDGNPEPVVTNRGSLTSTGLFTARRLAQKLEGKKLDEVYGCPDCADGGASRVTLRRQGVESTHAYDFQGAPPVLAEADAFLQGLIDAMRRCEESEYVKPGAECTGESR